MREKFMHARRKPEEGLLNAFSGETMGTTKNKVNESKGGGALTRVVPIGLLYAGDSKTAFNAGVRAAAFSPLDSCRLLCGRGGIGTDCLPC